jgi:hypothetical protein
MRNASETMLRQNPEFTKAQTTKCRSTKYRKAVYTSKMRGDIFSTYFS